MASKTLIEALDGIWAALTGSGGGGSSSGPARFQQVGIDGQPIDTSLPGLVTLQDQVNLGIYPGALSNDVIWQGDVTGFQSVLFEVQQLSGGSIRPETSVDPTFVRASQLPAYNVDQLNVPGPVLIMTSTAKYRVPVGAKYMRIRKVGDGATQVVVNLSQVAMDTIILQSGTIGYLETTANLTAGSTFTGNSRSTGMTMGGPQTRYKTFEASVFCDKTSELKIYESTDLGATYFLVSTTAVPASTMTRAKVDIFGTNYRADLKNVDATTATSTKLNTVLRT